MGPVAPPTLPLEGHPAPPMSTPIGRRDSDGRPSVEGQGCLEGGGGRGHFRPTLCCVTSGRPLGVSEPGIQVDEKRGGRAGRKVSNGGDLLHPGG